MIDPSVLLPYQILMGRVWGDTGSTKNTRHGFGSMTQREYKFFSLNTVVISYNYSGAGRSGFGLMHIVNRIYLYS